MPTSRLRKTGLYGVKRNFFRRLYLSFFFRGEGGVNLPGLVIKRKKMNNYIPEFKHKKIINGANYFYGLKPSDMNFSEFEKLMKFCKYILDDMQEKIEVNINGAQQQKTI